MFYHLCMYLLIKRHIMNPVIFCFKNLVKIWSLWQCKAERDLTMTYWWSCSMMSEWNFKPIALFVSDIVTPFLNNVNPESTLQRLLWLVDKFIFHANKKVHFDIKGHDLPWVIVRSLCALCSCRDLYFNSIDIFNYQYW